MSHSIARTRRRRGWPVLLGLAVWALATVAVTAVAVVLDAAELPPFATSSRWAPLIAAFSSLLPAWLAFRAARAAGR